jgi:hypothetical protein
VLAPDSVKELQSTQMLLIASTLSDASLKFISCHFHPTPNTQIHTVVLIFDLHQIKSVIFAQTLCFCAIIE